ncbi:hypothetical protein HHE06_09940 [Helicobacter heilmannii]|nr:hypothetical protein HHE06_09940 [Helicobacter heilmannii]
MSGWGLGGGEGMGRGGWWWGGGGVVTCCGRVLILPPLDERINELDRGYIDTKAIKTSKKKVKNQD